jgi:two-component system chemotaxis sensor kinase CheA
MKENHSDVFREEAAELLSDLEHSLLELEERPEDRELISRVFRAMHTIKGSGAMFGFDDVAAFTHEIETVYDRVRNGEVPVTKGLIDLTLQARDIIKDMLQSPGEAGQGNAAHQTVAAFRRLAAAGGEVTTPSSTSPSSGSASPTPLPPMYAEEGMTYRIRFKPAGDIFATGTNPLLLLNELKGMGDCKVIAQPDAIPDLEHMDPERCYTAWDLLMTTDQGLDAIKDVFIFVEDRCEIDIDVIAEKIAPEGYKRLGEILVDRGDITPGELREVLGEKKLIGQMLVEKGIVPPGKVESALMEQQHVRTQQEKERAKEEAISSIRVPADKLDTLVNLVGELVTVQARLSQTASMLEHAELLSVAEEIEHLTAELRDNTLNIRMLPIGTTFGRFKRLIRDLSQELGKQIEMTTEGAETELDKTVIERLNDPLVHLIRNAIDHGIESPDDRLAAGKPRVGRIRLSAVHSGANVVVEIADDGKGLDREAILARAIEKGLATPGAELGDREIYNFIFAPGFSTAKEVTNVSGRGVGMDVVRRSIDALRGSIDVKSAKGQGSTVIIKLPLTLAIVEGLLVGIADNRFVLPLSIVEECVELTRKDVAASHGRNIANIRGEIVPYIKLRHAFDIAGDPPDIEQIVITGVNGERVGFVVDSVIGEHQTVIKNLGKAYRDVDTISGATILGDGSVALIVDALKLAKNMETSEAAVA